MPSAQLPAEFSDFLSAPRPAVMATVRADGYPASTPCWFRWSDGRLLLSMHSHAARLRNLEANPRLSLTVLGDSWYQQLTVIGRVVELRPDDALTDIDQLSLAYRGVPHSPRTHRMVTATMEIERWHSFGFSEPEPEGANRE